MDLGRTALYRLENVDIHLVAEAISCSETPEANCSVVPITNLGFRENYDL